MKKINKAIAGIFMLIIFSSMVSALSIDINIKPSFDIGEEISFDYTILSETNQEIQYIVSVDCPNAPIPLLEIKSASLRANVPLTENYVYMSNLNDDVELQTCSAIVSILNPEISESKDFSISTNPSFEFNFLICKDVNCNEQTRIFILNENIYLNYNSSVGGIATTAVLTYPDEDIQQLVIPASIKAEQIGTYDLEITAFKSGYKTISEKVQFGVVEKEADVEYTNLKQQAEIVTDIAKAKRLKNIILILSFVVMLFFIILILIKIKREQ